MMMKVCPTTRGPRKKYPCRQEKYKSRSSQYLLHIIVHLKHIPVSQLRIHSFTNASPAGNFLTKTLTHAGTHTHTANTTQIPTTFSR